MKILSLTPQEVREIGSSLAGEVMPSDYKVIPLSGDGSARRFWRIQPNKETSSEMVIPKGGMIAVLPPISGSMALSEAQASCVIGCHLHSSGIPVPEVFGFDSVSGLLLFEDLGDTLLHHFVQEKGAAASMDWYKKAVEVLIHFQIDGRKGFDSTWCYDTAQYDRKLMLERESGYFVERFWKGYLGKEHLPVGLQDEFEKLADNAAKASVNYLMHRDFQSRNLMLCQGAIRIIDFQGARFGPLAYDLAALLLDPYTALSSDQRQVLLNHYLAYVSTKILLDQDVFLAEYYYMSLQRNLQILGAFGYLTNVGKKPFFHQYISPALNSLHDLLCQPAGQCFSNLKLLSEKAIILLGEINIDGIAPQGHLRRA